MTLSKKLSLKVPIKDILGLSYYRYNLTTSDYNPRIDTTITITVKCTDIFGNPINNKTLTLYENGTPLSNSTTNSNGEATWNKTLNDWDNHHFTIKGESLDLQATGYKTMAGASTSTYWLVRDKTTATLVLAGWECRSCNTSDWVKFGGDNYAETCRPLQFAMGLANNNNVVFRINYNSGEIVYRALKVNQSASPLYGAITWNIRESDL